MISFEWDEQKAKSNVLKHSVDFFEASTVFLDEDSLLISDPDHSIGEERFLILGLSKKGNLLVVSHCYKQKENIIRIISARKANKKEARDYYFRRAN